MSVIVLHMSQHQYKEVPDSVVHYHHYILLLLLNLGISIKQANEIKEFTVNRLENKVSLYMNDTVLQRADIKCHLIPLLQVLCNAIWMSACLSPSPVHFQQVNAKIFFVKVTPLHNNSVCYAQVTAVGVVVSVGGCTYYKGKWEAGETNL